MHRKFTYLFSGVLVSHFRCAPSGPAKQNERSRYLGKQSYYPHRVLPPHSNVPECSQDTLFTSRTLPPGSTYKCFPEPAVGNFLHQVPRWWLGASGGLWGLGRHPILSVKAEPCPRWFLLSPVSGTKWGVFFFFLISSCLLVPKLTVFSNSPEI